MYGKIFTRIFDSSIADETLGEGVLQELPLVRWIFSDLIALADENGVVDMTAASLARRIKVPRPIVEEALERLMAPDSSSRSKEAEGRRIVNLDDWRPWGWRIVNYGTYCRIRTAQQERALDARPSPAPAPADPSPATPPTAASAPPRAAPPTAPPPPPPPSPPAPAPAASGGARGGCAWGSGTVSGARGDGEGGEGSRTLDFPGSAGSREPDCAVARGFRASYIDLDLDVDLDPEASSRARAPAREAADGGEDEEGDPNASVESFTRGVWRAFKELSGKGRGFTRPEREMVAGWWEREIPLGFVESVVAEVGRRRSRRRIRSVAYFREVIPERWAAHLEEHPELRVDVDEERRSALWQLDMELFEVLGEARLAELRAELREASSAKQVEGVLHRALDAVEALDLAAPDASPDAGGAPASDGAPAAPDAEGPGQLRLPEVATEGPVAGRDVAWVPRTAPAVADDRGDRATGCGGDVAAVVDFPDVARDGAADGVRTAAGGGR